MIKLPKKKSRKRRGQQLPKGVYKLSKGPNYQAQVWKGDKVTYLGSYTTPEEAEYRRRWCLQRHHWEFFDDSSKYFGFIYIITNKSTGKMYIGSKQLYHWNGPPGGYKCTDPKSEWWDSRAWKESDWRTYTGSSQELNDEIAKGNIWDYSYQVLKMCKTKLELHMTEVAFLVDGNVLEATDDKGQYLYYNKNIAGKEFRPPFNRDQAKEMSERTMDRVRNYYLRPLMCPECYSIVPYGQHKCTDCLPKKQVGSSLSEGGGFNDVR